MCISPEAYFSVCCCMYILIYTYYIYIIHTYAENQNIGHRCNNMLMQVPLYVCRLVCSCSSSCIRHVHVCTGACTKAKIQDIHTHTHTHTHTHLLKHTLTSLLIRTWTPSKRKTENRSKSVTASLCETSSSNVH